MLEDRLNDKLSHRPSPEDLVKGGVLHEDPRVTEGENVEAVEEEHAKREGGSSSTATFKKSSESFVL